MQTLAATSPTSASPWIGRTSSSELRCSCGSFSGSVAWQLACCDGDGAAVGLCRPSPATGQAPPQRSLPPRAATSSARVPRVTGMAGEPHDELATAPLLAQPIASATAPLLARYGTKGSHSHSLLDSTFARLRRHLCSPATAPLLARNIKSGVMVCSCRVCYGCRRRRRRCCCWCV